MVGILTFTFVSVLFLFLGIVFRVWKKVELLSGYKEEDYDDKDGLAKWTGNMFFCMGVLSFGAVLISFLMPDPKQGIIFGVMFSMVVTLGGCIIMMVGCQKFKKK